MGIDVYENNRLMITFWKEKDFEVKQSSNMNIKENTLYN